MTERITVLVTPPGFQAPFMGDSRIDSVEIDRDAEVPRLERRTVSEEGNTAVDRALVTGQRKTQIANAIAAYQEETAKADPDVQVQLAELEKAISFMWDVVSGEDIGAELTRENAASSE